MDEDRLKKDLEAIEAEKKAFENGENVDLNEDSEKENPEEDSEEFEEVETEEMEFSLTEDEINEWINELTRLKEDKEFILLEVDEENTLKINYQEDSGGEEDEDEEDSGDEDSEEESE
jgi:hypothetical protein